MLRIPFMSAALGIDEGGLALVADQWADRSGSMYGGYWLDRSPLLLAIYWIAALGGEVGIRVLGALAALLLVALVALVARSLGGDAAGRIAAAASALLLGSPAIQAVFTHAELLAAVPSAACIALLAVAWQRSSARRWLFAAGLCASSAPLVKQSFICAATAALVFAVVIWFRRHEREHARGEIAALLAGIGLPIVLVEAWALTVGPGLVEFNYAMARFRIDALEALQGSRTPAHRRMAQIVAALVESGLILPLLAVPLGLRQLRRRPSLPVAIAAAWLVGAVVGMLLGGYYWRHYLIQLMPPVVVLGALGLSTVRPRVATACVATMAAIATVTSLGAALYLDRWPYQADMLAIVRVLDAEREPDDTIQVLYARANLVYYSGMQSPLPYQWSSMFRVMPEAERRLRQTLRTRDRPTWVVGWQNPDSFGLDESRATRRLLSRHYDRVATVCGHPVFLRSERSAPSAARVAASVSCDSAGTSLSQIARRVIRAERTHAASPPATVRAPWLLYVSASEAPPGPARRESSDRRFPTPAAGGGVGIA